MLRRLDVGQWQIPSRPSLEREQLFELATSLVHGWDGIKKIKVLFLIEFKYP